MRHSDDGHLARIELRQIELGRAHRARLARSEGSQDAMKGTAAKHRADRSGRNGRRGQKLAPALVDFVVGDDHAFRH